MKTVELLQQAKDTIVEYGWVGRNKDGPVWEKGTSECLLTSLPSEGLLRTVYALGFTGIFSGADDAIKWNDHPSRTKEQVLARFDTAITHLKKPWWVRWFTSPGFENG